MKWENSIWKKGTETTESYEVQDHEIGGRGKPPKKKKWCTETLSKVKEESADKTWREQMV
jgi:hypothetical protein